MTTGIGGVDEFALHGPWQVFTELNPNIPETGRQSYFDSTGVEYLIGSGPAPLLGTNGSLQNFIDPITGIISVASTSIPITSSANIIPLQTNSIEDYLNTLPGFSTISSLLEGTLLGIPNWILGLGVAGFFLINELNGKGRK